MCVSCVTSAETALAGVGVTLASARHALTQFRLGRLPIEERTARAEEKWITDAQLMRSLGHDPESILGQRPSPDSVAGDAEQAHIHAGADHVGDRDSRTPGASGPGREQHLAGRAHDVHDDAEPLKALDPALRHDLTSMAPA